MKWDKANKKKVWLALKRTAQSDVGLWERLQTLGAIPVYRGGAISSTSMMWMQRDNHAPVYVDPWGQGYKPAVSKAHVIINDVFHWNPGWGVKIPKDVAEKCLVLGVP